MSEKIVLIDGHSILNRAFYGVPDLTNSEGMHTNAVYGFLNIMFKILDTEKPEYLTVAFDVKKPTFRHEMFKEYKGTRKPMPEELRQQVPIIQQVLEAMGITIVKGSGIAEEDLAVAFQTVQTFLDAGTAGIIHADYVSDDLAGILKDLADLIGLNFAHGAADNGKILGISVDDAAVYLAVAANNTITGEVLLFLAKVVAAMDNEGINLNKGVGIEQGLETLTSGQFALLMLLFDTRLAATESD